MPINCSPKSKIVGILLLQHYCWMSPFLLPFGEEENFQLLETAEKYFSIPPLASIDLTKLLLLDPAIIQALARGTVWSSKISQCKRIHTSSSWADVLSVSKFLT